MKRLLLVTTLSLAAFPPLQASAQDILKQRIGDIANRVGGVFAEDQYGHMLKSLKERRDLKLSLMRDHERKAEALLAELAQLEQEIAALEPGYVPVEHRPAMEQVAPDPVWSLESFAPAPITECVLNRDGTIGACETGGAE